MARGVLAPAAARYSVTGVGRVWLDELGIDVDALKQKPRSFARSCPDWSERRPHLAGSLGAGIASTFFARGWVRRRPGGRAVVVTTAGAEWLEGALGVAAPR